MYSPALRSASIVDVPPPCTVSPFSLTPLPSIAMSCGVVESFFESIVSWPAGASAFLNV